jgi:hypothetical protein
MLAVIMLLAAIHGGQYKLEDPAEYNVLDLQKFTYNTLI